MTGSPAGFLYPALICALIASRAAYLFPFHSVTNLRSRNKLAFPTHQPTYRPPTPTSPEGTPAVLGITGLDEGIVDFKKYFSKFD